MHSRFIHGNFARKVMFLFVSPLSREWASSSLQPWGVNYRAHTVLENVTDFKHYRVRVPSSGFRDSERKVRTLRIMPVVGPSNCSDSGINCRSSWTGGQWLMNGPKIWSINCTLTGRRFVSFFSKTWGGSAHTGSQISGSRSTVTVCEKFITTLTPSRNSSDGFCTGEESYRLTLRLPD